MRILRYVSPLERLGPEGQTVRRAKADDYIWRVTDANGQWMADLTTLDHVRLLLRTDATECSPAEARELERD